MIEMKFLHSLSPADVSHYFNPTVNVNRVFAISFNYSKSVLVCRVLLLHSPDSATIPMCDNLPSKAGVCQVVCSVGIKYRRFWSWAFKYEGWNNSVSPLVYHLKPHSASQRYLNLMFRMRQKGLLKKGLLLVVTPPLLHWVILMEVLVKPRTMKNFVPKTSIPWYKSSISKAKHTSH